MFWAARIFLKRWLQYQGRMHPIPLLEAPQFGDGYPFKKFGFVAKKVVGAAVPAEKRYV